MEQEAEGLSFTFMSPEEWNKSDSFFLKVFSPINPLARGFEGLEPFLDVIESLDAELRPDETYFMRGGMEAIYNDNRRPVGLQAFAPGVPARGPMFSARTRLRVPGETPAQPAGAGEPDLY